MVDSTQAWGVGLGAGVAVGGGVAVAVGVGAGAAVGVAAVVGTGEAASRVLTWGAGNNVGGALWQATSALNMISGRM